MEVDEMMELAESSNTKEKWELPKNIRQIGEPGQEVKVFVEDYVSIYLHDLAKANLTCIKTALLTGKVQEGNRIYIQGALEIDMGQEIKEWFSNEHWRTIFQLLEKWFQGQEVLGWFLSNPGFPPSLTEEIKYLHQNHFSAKQHLLFQMDILENEEVFYAYGEQGLAPLTGYYIYYEKNQQMQEYRSQMRHGQGIEREGILRDRAATRFRNVMQEKKEQTVQKKTMAILYTSCSFLLMVVFVIGITLVNHYDRMKDMEDELHQISASIMDHTNTEKTKENSTIEVIEETVQETEPEVIEEIPEEKLPEENIEEEKAEENKEEVEKASEEATEQEEDTNTVEEAEEVLSETVQETEAYYIKPGDTLIKICRERYGDEEMVKKLCELNQLENGDKIYIGQMILLP